MMKDKCVEHKVIYENKNSELMLFKNDKGYDIYHDVCHEGAHLLFEDLTRDDLLDMVSNFIDIIKKLDEN